VLPVCQAFWWQRWSQGDIFVIHLHGTEVSVDVSLFIQIVFLSVYIEMSVYEIDSIDTLNNMIDECEKNDKFLIIKASASWCGPCRAVQPKYHDMAQKYTNSVFVTFDVDEQQDIAEQFSISAMPTFIVVKGRDIIKRIEGVDLQAIQQVLV
jgi:thioredoxin 1